jgi:hypothetical protein
MLSQKNQAADTWMLLQLSQVRAMLEVSKISHQMPQPQYIV